MLRGGELDEYILKAPQEQQAQQIAPPPQYPPPQDQNPRPNNIQKMAEAEGEEEADKLTMQLNRMKHLRMIKCHHYLGILT